MNFGGGFGAVGSEYAGGYAGGGGAEDVALLQMGLEELYGWGRTGYTYGDDVDTAESDG